MTTSFRVRLVAFAVLVASSLALGTQPSAQSAPYRILLTNDDGVRAPGILALAQALGRVGELTIAAPNDNQSGKGHSITIGDPIYVDRVTIANGQAAYAVSGTPATCVKVGIGALMTLKPDLVVSGINRGYNLGRVTYVSGTVGAAREASLMDIPAVAASLSTDESDYAPAAELVRQVVEMVRKNGLPKGAFLNVNVPPGTANAIKGIQLTRQSRLTGVERFEEQKSPAGRRYFWSIWNEPAGDAEGTDVWAVEHGYAAVTPLAATEFDQQTLRRLADEDHRQVKTLRRPASTKAEAPRDRQRAAVRLERSPYRRFPDAPHVPDHCSRDDPRQSEPPMPFQRVDRDVPERFGLENGVTERDRRAADPRRRDRNRRR